MNQCVTRCWWQSQVKIWGEQRRAGPPLPAPLREASEEREEGSGRCTGLAASGKRAGFPGELADGITGSETIEKKAQNKKQSLRREGVKATSEGLGYSPGKRCTCLLECVLVCTACVPCSTHLLFTWPGAGCSSVLCLNLQTAVFSLLPEVPCRLYFFQWVLCKSWQERQRKLLVCSLCRASTGNSGAA